MTEQLHGALLEHQAAFGVELSEDALGRFATYYDFLISRNDLLHLVAPCSAEEFAIRHILESVFIAKIIQSKGKVADVGSGGGLPGIPLAIFRKDLELILIESKAKKAEFLRQAADECGIGRRIRVVNKQFAEATLPPKYVVTSRALDKFPKVVLKLIGWAKGRRMILFGGPSLEEALRAAKVRFKKTLIPMSEQRFVFQVGGSIEH